ncbi:MAG TPA: GAF domain-containing protein, partial [Anaerolineae bacterium]|nr:GAF domain-containing protein [Anaerolineae bacterium]
ISVMCVPLVSHGQLIGLIYADNHSIYGRFAQADLNLLSAFANQAASAIENARLYQGLEQRVAERTAELQASNQSLAQRNAELAVINSVQQGLAAQLNFQAIIDLVGDKIRDVFDAQVVLIGRHDPQRSQIEFPYFVERGERLVMPAVPLGHGFSSIVIQSRRTLVLLNAHDIERLMVETRSLLVGDAPKSWLGVPIIVGAHVTGVISLQNVDRENAFSESDVNLLQTLASSTSVALENARLFDETQRLFQAEQQRAAELAIINSVQEGLASKLEMQGIYDLVGDRIRDIFDAQVVAINTYDRRMDLLHYRYLIERGRRLQVDPQPLGDNGFTPLVIRTRQLVLINTHMEQRAAEVGSVVVAGEAPKSALYVPLIVGDEAKGVISLQNIDRENAFSDSDVSLLQTLAASMSVALENARLFEETRRLLAETQQRSAELAVINSVQQGLASQLDFQAIIDLVGDKIRDIFDAQAVLITLYDRRADLIHHRYLIERGQRFVIEAPLPVDRFRQRVIESQQPWLISQDYERVASELGEEPVLTGDVPKSLLFVPMIIGSEVTGIISLQNLDREHAFSDPDVRLLTTIAASMSVALENARLFGETKRLLEETNRRAAELAIINSVGQVLTQELDLHSLIDLVGDKLRAAIKAENFGIGLYESKSKLLQSVYVYRDDHRIYPDPTPLNAFSLRVARQGRPLVINHNTPQTWKKFGSNLTVGTEFPKSVLMIPILAGRELIGGITVQDFKRENAFPDSVVRMLETIASNMGTAIQNARLFDETQRLFRAEQQRAAELATVNTVSQAIASELDLAALIALIGEQMRQTFNADIVYVALHDRQMNLITFPYYMEAGQRRDNPPLEFGHGMTSRIIESRRALLLNREQDYATLNIARVGTRSKSYLGVPIITGDQGIGVISVQNTTQEGRFGEDDVRLLSTIAANVGVAIQNARLYQETQRRAEEMATLAEIGNDIAATLDMEPVLERIAVRAKDLLRVRDIAIYLREADG